MIKRLLQELRRLRWQLAFAFTMTTTLVLTVFFAAVFAFAASTAGTREEQARDVAAVMAQISDQVAPIMASRPIDSTRLSILLTRMLERSGVGSTTLQATVSLGIGDEPDFEGIRDEQIYILALDDQGRLVGSTAVDDRLALAQPFAFERLPGLVDLLDGANGQQPFLFDRPAQRGMVISPVGTTPRLGTLVFVVENLTEESFSLPELLGNLGATIGWLSVVAAVIGLILGLAVSHGLTRRIRAIERVTAAWGNGDFTPRLHDRSADEIGLLSQQLNSVADRIQQLIQERQQFATLEERNRLARDLHDSVKQHVFAASMSLGAAEELWRTNPTGAAAMAAHAALATAEAKRELTDMIHALRPPALAQAELAPALVQFAAQWSEQSGIAVASQIDPTIRVEPQIEEVLFRITQEALANVARHSGARSVGLSLQQEKGAIVLRISDNGRGFNPAKVAAGFGLRSMRERTALIGAELRVKSSAAGSEISVHVGL
jgi:two-component system, NarL family, sensor histidine kinase LiaS